MQNEIQRTCGECSECCKTHAIIELKKRAGKWCGFRIKGQGCRIYQKRPIGCVDFQCQWLKGHGEDSDRPDRTGIVVDFSDFVLEAIGKIKIVVLMEGRNGVFGEKYGKMLVSSYLNFGYLVLQKYLSGKEVVMVPQKSQIPRGKLKALVEEKRKVLIAEVH